MNLRVGILPKTKLGRWSLGLAVAMPVFLSIGMFVTTPLYESVPAGNTILEDIILRPALALTMLTGMVSGVSAFIVGLIAIIRRKERAVLVYVATSAGAFITIFLLGELIFPH